MLKFNFANLNNRFKAASDSEQKRRGDDVVLDGYATQTGADHERQAMDIPACPKPRYSAYRTVVARHEQFAARIKAKNHCDDGACDQNACNKEASESDGCNGDCQDVSGDNGACEGNSRDNGGDKRA